MSLSADYPPFLLRSIFHPSDFTPASDIAFVHALKLAHAARADLRLMHVANNADDKSGGEFPSIRSTLVHWGVLAAGSAREEVALLGFQVHKVQFLKAEPMKAILHYLERHPVDLVILATHRRQGLARLFHKAIAEPVARHTEAMTLFMPQGVDGFVLPDTGAVTLHRILVPITTVPTPQTAVETAAGIALTLGCDKVTFTLVQVGKADALPEIPTPQRPGWTWERVVRRGPVVEQVLEIARAGAANLIVLTTQRRHGLLDTLRGSTSERILHGARCPVLAIPVDDD